MRGCCAGYAEISLFLSMDVPAVTTEVGGSTAVHHMMAISTDDSRPSNALRTICPNLSDIDQP
jgi:hypothetical protein